MVVVSRNGQLRDDGPYRTMDNMTRTCTKVIRYRLDNASWQVPYAFLPCIASTPCRKHAEFLRLFYIIACHRPIAWLQRLGIEEPGSDAFTWRRSEYFCHTRATIGLAIAPPASLLGFDFVSLPPFSG